MEKKRYAHVGIGGRARMYYKAIACDFNETSELVAFCDINQTRMLTNACKTMEMQLLDHIVIGSGSYYSFADECTAKYKK